jgi:hypothetical protein
MAGGTNFGVIEDVNHLRLSLASIAIGTAGTNTGTTSFPLVQRLGLLASNLPHAWYLCSVDAINSPLPVELIFFEGKANGNVVYLDWQTQSELNNESFTVLRSTDGKIFLPVGSVDGQGTTRQSHDYQIQDLVPEKGIYYYRLEQMDFDKKTEIVKTIVVEVKNGNSTAGVFPNPVATGNSITLLLSGLSPDKEQEVQFVDLQGLVHSRQKITTDENGNFRGQLKTEVAPGLYILKVNAVAVKLLVN